MRKTQQQVAGALISIWSLIGSVRAGAVYGCYKDQAPAPNPGHGIGASLIATNRASNCDDSASPGDVTFFGESYEVAATLSNSAKSGVHNAQHTVMESFQHVVQQCTHGLGYWYFDGDDHTTGVVNWKSELEAYSPKHKRSSLSPRSLEDIHALFGGPPNDGTFYVPDGGILPGGKLHDYSVALKDLQSVIRLECPKIRGRRATSLSALSVRSGTSSHSDNRLGTRYEGSGCTATGQVVNNANGFDVRIVEGIYGLLSGIASGPCDGLAQRLIATVSDPAHIDSQDTFVRGIVASSTAIFFSAEPLGATWRSRLSLVTQSALNTLVFDIALDMSRHLYNEATYVVADGAGNVVVRIVAWAESNLGPFWEDDY